MIVIMAPHDLPQTILELPNPEWQDGEGLLVKVLMKRAEDGTRRTYVRKTGERKITLSFSVDRKEQQEIQNFIDAFKGEKWRIYTHKNEIWVVNFVDDIMTFPRSRGEFSIVNISLRGVQTNA